MKELYSDIKSIKKIFNEIDDMVFLVDEKGKILWFNCSAKKKLAQNFRNIFFTDLFDVDPKILSTKNRTATAPAIIDTTESVFNHKFVSYLYSGSKKNKIIVSHIETDRSCENKTQNDYYKQMIDRSRAMFAYFDNNGSIMASNIFFKNFHSKNFNTRKCRDIVKTYKTGLAASDEKIQQAIADAFSGIKSTSEIWHLNEEKMHLLQIIFFPIKKNDKYDVILYARDITESIKMEAKILEVMHEERKKVGISLHDNLGHDLLAIAIQSRLLRDKLSDAGSPLKDELRKIEDDIKNSINEVRRLSHGLIPFKNYGLEFREMLDAVSLTIERNYNHQCEIKINDDFHIEDESIIKELYYIAEEAVANSAKHSSSTKIQIEAGYIKNQGYLKVVDNGGGFSTVGADESGIGFEIMKYRARSIGGDLEIITDRAGTTVLCTFSVKKIY